MSINVPILQFLGQYCFNVTYNVTVSNTKFWFIVGGIYTVIRSKAPVTVDELKNEYCLVGPYKEHKVNLEVEICEPQLPAIREAMDILQREGIKVSKLTLSFQISPYWSVNLSGTKWTSDNKIPIWVENCEGLFFFLISGLSLLKNKIVRHQSE